MKLENESQFVIVMKVLAKVMEDLKGKIDSFSQEYQLEGIRYYQ